MNQLKVSYTGLDTVWHETQRALSEMGVDTDDMTCLDRDQVAKAIVAGVNRALADGTARVVGHERTV